MQDCLAHNHNEEYREKIHMHIASMCQSCHLNNSSLFNNFTYFFVVGMLLFKKRKNRNSQQTCYSPSPCKHWLEELVKPLWCLRHMLVVRGFFCWDTRRQKRCPQKQVRLNFLLPELKSFALSTFLSIRVQIYSRPLPIPQAKVKTLWSSLIVFVFMKIIGITTSF